MVWNTGYIFALGRQHKDPVEDEISAYSTNQISSERTALSCTLATPIEEAKSSMQKHSQAHRITCTADFSRWRQWKSVSASLTVMQ